MRSIRTIAYVSIAVLVVSMLAIGAVSAKADGNGKMLKNDGDCICDGDCLNAGTCPYDGDCPYDGQCVNTDCQLNDYDCSYDYLYGGKH